MSEVKNMGKDLGLIEDLAQSAWKEFMRTGEVKYYLLHRSLSDPFSADYKYKKDDNLFEKIQ